LTLYFVTPLCCVHWVCGPHCPHAISPTMPIPCLLHSIHFVVYCVGATPLSVVTHSIYPTPVHLVTVPHYHLYICSFLLHCPLHCSCFPPIYIYTHLTTHTLTEPTFTLPGLLLVVVVTFFGFYYTRLLLPHYLPRTYIPHSHSTYHCALPVAFVRLPLCVVSSCFDYTLTMTLFGCWHYGTFGYTTVVYFVILLHCCCFVSYIYSPLLPHQPGLFCLIIPFTTYYTFCRFNL